MTLRGARRTLSQQGGVVLPGRGLQGEGAARAEAEDDTGHVEGEGAPLRRTQSALGMGLQAEEAEEEGRSGPTRNGARLSLGLSSGTGYRRRLGGFGGGAAGAVSERGTQRRAENFDAEEKAQLLQALAQQRQAGQPGTQVRTLLCSFVNAALVYDCGHAGSGVFLSVRGLQHQQQAIPGRALQAPPLWRCMHLPWDARHACRFHDFSLPSGACAVGPVEQAESRRGKSMTGSSAWANPKWAAASSTTGAEAGTRRLLAEGGGAEAGWLRGGGSGVRSGGRRVQDGPEEVDFRRTSSLYVEKHQRRLAQGPGSGAGLTGGDILFQRNATLTSRAREQHGPHLQEDSRSQQHRPEAEQRSLGGGSLHARRLGGAPSGGADSSGPGGASGKPTVRPAGSTASRLQAAREQFVQEYGASLGGRSGPSAASYERQLTGASASRGATERGLARGRGPAADVGSTEWEGRRARRTVTVHHGALPDCEAGPESTPSARGKAIREGGQGGRTGQGWQNSREEAVPADGLWEEAEGSVAPPMRRRATVTASLHGTSTRAAEDWTSTPQGLEASPERTDRLGNPSHSHAPQGEGAKALQEEGLSGGRKLLDSRRSLSPLRQWNDPGGAQQQLDGAQAFDAYAAGDLHGGTDSSLPTQGQP